MNRLLALALLATACAPLPPAGPARALFVDLDQITTGRERTDWVVDRIELEGVADDLMRSYCPTPAADRDALRAWLSEQLTLHGGSAEAAWRAAGQDLDAADDALHLERVALLLRHGATYENDCPFWLPQDAEFAGVHADAHRFVLQAETMGAFQLVFPEGGDTVFGGAGLGRLLAGVGLNHRFTLLAGLEMGLASELDRAEGGEVRLKPGFAAGIPVVLRTHAGSLRFDAGLALTGRSADPDFSDPRFGVRYDVAVGVATLRIAGVQPFVMLWTGHEWLPESDGRPALHSLRAGSRVGVNWDP